MRIAHRRGVVEGVVVGAAIAGSRRAPAVAVVPAPYYGAGAAPVAAAAMYGAAAARPPTTEVIINQGPGYMPPNPGYYPPPVQPGMAPYPQYPQYPQSAPYPGAMPPPMVAPAPMPAPMPVPMAAPMAPMPAPMAPMAPMPAPMAPPPYASPPAVAPTYVIEPPAPAIVPAAVAAGAAVKAAEAAVVVKAFEKRKCYLVNEATNTVLEVKRGNAKPGAEVTLDKRHKDRPLHQQWYLDEHGIIHSCLNDFVMESKGNGENLRMMPLTGDARQKWTHQNNRIVNAVFCNDCVGAKKGLVRVKDDADIISCPYEGKPYQNWRIEFI